MKHTLLIISLLVFSFVSHGQVRELQIDALSNSIVRTVDDEYRLIYTEIAPGIGHFILYCQETADAIAFKLPDKWSIRDVRIWDKKEAYFCGTYDDHGLIGKFDIFSLFSGSSGIDYALCIGVSHMGYVYLDDLKRLDLFQTSGPSGDTVNMAIVGASTFFDPGTTQGTSVSSARFDGTLWEINTFFNKGYEYNYTDIACLDDVIVAAATDPNGKGCYLRTYRSTYSDFLSNYYINGTIYKIDYQMPEGDVLVAHASGNTSVFAHYDNTPGAVVSTVLHEVYIDPATGVPPATIPTWRTDPASTVPYGVQWKMHELNVAQDKYPYLLQKADYPAAAYTGIHDWLLEMQLIHAPYAASAWFPDLCTAHSMDLEMSYYQPLVSGEKTRLRLYHAPWTPAVTPCTPFSSIMVKYDNASSMICHTDTSTDPMSVPNDVFMPTLYPIDIEDICY